MSDPKHVHHAGCSPAIVNQHALGCRLPEPPEPKHGGTLTLDEYRAWEAGR